MKLGKVICVYSNLIETELVKAPEKVREYFKDLPKENLERVEIDDETIALATKYIEEKSGWRNEF